MSQIVKEKENEIIKFINSINIYEITNEKIEKILPAIKVLFTKLILSESSESTLKKFIKLSIHLIKYAHYDLVQNLSKFKASDETNNELVNDIYLLELLYSPIVSLSDKSIEFCNYFHQEESENGIQVLFGLVMDEKLLSIQHETETNNITLYLDRFIAGNVFMALLNISKAYDRNKDKWNNLNAYQKLLDLSQKINKKNVILKCIMTMGNIASDEDLNNFSSSPKGFKFLTAQIDRFSNALKDKLYLNDNKEFEEMGNIASDEDLNNFSAKINRLFSNALKDNKEFKRELFRIDEGEEKVKIIQDNEEDWNLYECLQALYKFAINDKLKNTIYETFQMKDSLRKIVYNGNETEQEYGFKVLNQLCFDKNIALDISNDKDLMKFMNDLILKKTNEKKLVKNIDGILWLINKKGEKEIKSEDLKKHVFISYNSESRSICLDIKTFLEKIGFKCWIDIENIHGSSIDAMAKGIEAASCVLICMTEKYKESNNCRMEAEYTLQRKIPFIPLILQKSYRPDGWLVSQLLVFKIQYQFLY